MLGDGCPGTGYHGSNGWEEECIVMQTVKVSTFYTVERERERVGKKWGNRFVPSFEQLFLSSDNVCTFNTIICTSK